MIEMTARTARKPLTPAQQEKIAAEREAKAQAAAALLSEAVAKLMTAEGWQAMIERRTWLRKYSLNNLLLIMAQCPEATDVRPYGARTNPQDGSWLKVGRHAVKGSTAIKIYAPLFRTDEATGERRLYAFKLVPVFDVSQTEGEPLPAPVDVKVDLLVGDAPFELWEKVEKIIVGLGYSVTRAPMPPEFAGANGLTEFGPRRVTVRPDVEPAQAVKTLIHELAHILCEHGGARDDLGRPQAEVEAESVACIVMNLAGASSLPYSVGYVAGWAGTPEIVEKSAKTVLKVADRIAEELDL